MFNENDPLTALDPEAIVVSETVDINAPASLVWKILLDMPKYGDWNPFCVECESTLEMGAAVKMKLKSYVNCEPEFFENTEYVCAFEPEKQISWALPHYDAWPYPARRDQYIEATSAQTCKYYSTDEFRGPNDKIRRQIVEIAQLFMACLNAPTCRGADKCIAIPQTDEENMRLTFTFNHHGIK